VFRDLIVAFEEVVRVRPDELVESKRTVFQAGNQFVKSNQNSTTEAREPQRSRAATDGQKIENSE
jgi:hypothetical protein